jgi:hypothetical protein
MRRAGAMPEQLGYASVLLTRVSAPEGVFAGTHEDHGTCAYVPVPPGKAGRRLPRYRAALEMATAPVLGSQLIFPRRFDAACERLLANPGAPGISASHSQRFFGASMKLEINPALLRRRISDFVFDGRSVRWVGLSLLDGADWSAALAPLRRSPVHRELSQLVAAGLDFRRTPAYEGQLRAAREGRPVRRNGVTLATTGQVEDYFRYCAEVVTSIRRHGVVRRDELGRIGVSRPDHGKARPAALDRVERDIGVAVNADGELIRHLGGKHRTAIAKALRLPSIPVEVRFVHVRWLADHMKNTGLPAHLALPHALADLRARYMPGATLSTRQPA